MVKIGRASILILGEKIHALIYNYESFMLGGPQ